jgi:hypothetical protein
VLLEGAVEGTHNARTERPTAKKGGKRQGKGGKQIRTNSDVEEITCDFFSTQSLGSILFFHPHLAAPKKDRFIILC